MKKEKITCSKCEKEKHVSKFYKTKTTRGYAYECVECNKEYTSQNRERINKNSNNYRKKYPLKNIKTALRHIIKQFKKEHGCIICGEKESICLDFHHKFHTDKVETISDMIDNSFSIDDITKEICKCIIVCCNCHRKIHANILSTNEINCCTISKEYIEQSRKKLLTEYDYERNT